MSNNQETGDPPILLKVDTRLDYPNGTPAVSIYIDGLLCVGFHDSQCVIAYHQPVARHEPVFAIWEKKAPCKRKFEEIGRASCRERVYVLV